MVHGPIASAPPVGAESEMENSGPCPKPPRLEPAFQQDPQEIHAHVIVWKALKYETWKTNQPIPKVQILM